MNFGFEEEQELLRREIRKFLDEQCPMEEVRRLAQSSDGYSREQWKQLAELGWLGLMLPEAYGGAELTWVDAVVLLEETGRSLFPSPLISTTLAGSAIADLGSEDQKGRWLPGLADGSRIGTIAFLEDNDVLGPAGIQLRGRPRGDAFLLSGEKRLVADVEQADLWLVPFRVGDPEDAIAIAVVERDADGASGRPLPSIDRTKRTGTLQLDEVPVGPDALLGPPAGASLGLSRVLDRGALALCAEVIGAAEAALRITVEFAKQREQFGHPIGHFQGVKHPLAEMYVEVESLKSLLYYAAWAIDEDPEVAPAAISRAKAYAADAFTRIGIDGIQLHGGVGYTLEYDIQLYLKRSKWARSMYGDADYHYDRVARARGL
ncbi:MAG: acyl-CoA dehydrogenase family protein [Myxococcales bacterium]|nr:acyl-CoA dehydrogenase family protein [Myxococcales bacterium]